MDWKTTLLYLVNRFKEPSSWVGLAGLVTLAGLHLSTIQINYIIDIGVGVCGLLAFAIPEKK